MSLPKTGVANIPSLNSGNGETVARSELSVVVPIYNVRPEYLHACVTSVARQQGSVAGELILVDDGSRRACHATAKSLARRLSGLGFASRLVTLKSHQGMAAARNAGVEVARSRYVLFLDADDLLAPHAFESLRPHLQCASASLLFADHVHVDADAKTALAVRRKSDYAALIHAWRGTAFDPFFHATFLIHPQVVRKDAFESLGGLCPDYGYGDEVVMHLRLAQRPALGEIAHVPEILYWYRKNPESVVHNPVLYRRLIANIEGILLSEMRRLLPDIGSCRRIGRATATHAAHYQYRQYDGLPLTVPWFDPRALSLSTDAR